MKEFVLKGEFVDLCDLLKLTQLTSSGGEAKQFIAAGEVKVDGAVELRKRCKIRKGQMVEFKGQKVQVS